MAKNKGSGFLFHKDDLNRFLETIYSKSTAKISIKTRHGKYDHDEFYDLLQIFKQYPMEELIIHPRIQKDMYKNTPNLEVFSAALDTISCPICYNGDIFSVKDFESMKARFPQIDRWMLGRGVIGNPALVGQIKTGIMSDQDTFRKFHDRLYADYQLVMSGERNVLFKMKELWFYMMPLFTEDKKYGKKIKKCEKLRDYEAIIDSLFSEERILADTPGYRSVVESLR